MILVWLAVIDPFPRAVEVFPRCVLLSFRDSVSPVAPVASITGFVAGSCHRSRTGRWRGSEPIVLLARRPADSRIEKGCGSRWDTSRVLGGTSRQGATSIQPSSIPSARCCAWIRPLVASAAAFAEHPTYLRPCSTTPWYARRAVGSWGRCVCNVQSRVDQFSDTRRSLFQFQFEMIKLLRVQHAREFEFRRKTDSSPCPI